MSDRPEWKEWILEKNAAFEQEELNKTDNIVLEKANNPKAGSSELGDHHIPLIHAGLSVLGHKGHKVENLNAPHNHGLHVTFHPKDQENHEDHIKQVLSHHGIKHGGAQQNDNDEEGGSGVQNEHFIHPHK